MPDLVDKRSVPSELRDDLARLSRILAVRLGLHFPQDRLRDLWRNLAAASGDLGYADATSCLHGLIRSSFDGDEVEKLAPYLTVGETYFFRERPVLDIFEQEALPELVQERRENGRSLRVMSAGCCTGEEPYTIAMILSRVLPDLADWRITVVGADLNEHFLEHARRGVYREWSFRDAPSWLRERHFVTRGGGQYHLVPKIRNMVRFARLNLASDAYPSLPNDLHSMDVIFCRNVLMYFTPGVARSVLARLYRCLRPGGWLMVAPAEVPIVAGSAFSPMIFTGATVFRRTDAIPRVRSVASPAAGSREPQPVDAPWAGRTRKSRPDRGPARRRNGTTVDRIRPKAARTTESADTIACARALFDKGKYEETVALLSSEGKKHSDAPEQRYILLARACANLGRLDAAADWCRQAISTNRLNPGSRYLLATVLQAQGRNVDAERELKATVYLDDSFVLAHVALGNIARGSDRPAEAQRHYRNALTGLEGLSEDATVPESDGVGVRQMAELLQAMPGTRTR